MQCSDPQCSVSFTRGMREQHEGSTVKKVRGMDRGVSCGEERSPLPEAESSSLLRLPKDCQLLLGEVCSVAGRLLY